MGDWEWQRNDETTALLAEHASAPPFEAHLRREMARGYDPLRRCSHQGRDGASALALALTLGARDAILAIGERAPLDPIGRGQPDLVAAEARDTLAALLRAPAAGSRFEEGVEALRLAGLPPTRLDDRATWRGVRGERNPGERQTLLIKAIASDADHALVARLAAAGFVRLDQDTFYTAPLVHAVRHGFARVTAAVLAALPAIAADRPIGDCLGTRPLHYAANAECAALLLAAGADPNAKDNQDVAPLHWARDGRVVAALCEAGARLDEPIPVAGGRTPLLCAVEDARVSAIAELAARGASLRTRTDDGATALMIAERNAVAPYCAAPLRRERFKTLRLIERLFERDALAAALPPPDAVAEADAPTGRRRL